MYFHWLQTTFSSFPHAFFILFFIALLVSTLGFYRFIYFISLGYAFSILAMSLSTLYLYRTNLTWLNLMQCGILGIYALRLGLFLLRREFQQSYRNELDAVQEETNQIPRVAKLTIWPVVALLYTMMFSPCLFNFETASTAEFSTLSLVQSTGLIIMLFGFSLESLADRQKSAFKKSHPQRFCDSGLYRWVRSPNYLGEILFWFGNWVAGWLAFDSVYKWMIATLGLIGIILIMLISTRRLELKQSTRYGDLPEYQSYIRNVPILLPRTKLYSMKFLDWLPFT